VKLAPHGDSELMNIGSQAMQTSGDQLRNVFWVSARRSIAAHKSSKAKSARVIGSIGAMATSAVFFAMYVGNGIAYGSIVGLKGVRQTSKTSAFAG
jgi:hypothetical protein